MILNSPYITGSLTVTGNANIQGTITVTGSLVGTATSAINSVSASKAVSSSYSDTASFSNNFTVLGNLTVYGTQSVQYITSSQLNVANNIINVNVGTPGVRFGGLSVYDSGSQAGATGSLYWDSQNNRWIYQQETGSTYTGGMLISGPRNFGGLGNEEGTTNNALMKGQGGDHITSSAIFEISGSVGIGTSSPSANLTVSGSIRAYGNQTDVILNSTGSAQYSRISFEENGADKAQVQFINSAFPSGNRAGRLEICNAASGGQGISFVSAVSSFNTPQMFISSSGYIGIGTTTPAALIHGLIPSATNTFTEILRMSDGVICDFKVYLSRGADANTSLAVLNTYSGNMSFQTGNTERLRISGSYVGIGVTNPIAPLTIAPSAVGASITATNGQTAYNYSRLRITHYTDSSVGLSIGYAGANYTYLQACYNEGSVAPLLLNPFNGSVGIGTNSPASAALTIHVSGSGGADRSGNQIWIKGGNTNVTNASNALVLSYSDSLLYSHAIKTTHNSAAINGNAIDFYVWNYGTDSTTTVGTRKIMSVDGTGVTKPSQPSFGAYRTNSSFTITNSSDTTLPYNGVTYDTAGNYNSSTYRFYAPVAGKYLFIANIRYDGASSGSYLRTYFTINGSSGSPVFIYGMQISGAGGYSSNYQSHNISSILNLGAGDWVDVRGGINVGSVTMHQESSFFGYLIG